MKYNFPLLLKENDSVSMLLKYVQPNSTVLEFGCANGRMTRFMQEELGCKVYIVEYDAEAYQDAERFAEDGVCGDIMNYEWENKFSNIEFDYIVFADVLEHLSNPKDVISRCQSLLKFNGTMLVSVPNIGHNDILIKLYQGRFEYTKTGLLDDTHIHFFSEKTVKSFFEAVGYFVTDISCTVIPTGQTEQYENEELSLSPILENIANGRVNGEVYQYILALNKMDYAIKQELQESNLKPIYKELFGKLYLDYGSGFAEENVEYISFTQNDEGKYEGIIEKSILGVRNIRIDPVENRNCIIHALSVSLDSKDIDTIFINSLNGEEDVLLLGPDPQILAKLSSDGRLLINIVFSLEGTDIYSGSEQRILASCSEEISKLNKSISLLEENHERELRDVVDKFKAKANRVEYLEKYINDLKNSRSWKVTKPFRTAKRYGLKVKKHRP